MKHAMYLPGKLLQMVPLLQHAHSWAWASVYSNTCKSARLQAISSPLLDVGIQRATGIVWNITGPPDLTLFEVRLLRSVWLAQCIRCVAHVKHLSAGHVACMWSGRLSARQCCVYFMHGTLLHQRSRYLVLTPAQELLTTSAGQ